jgi:hypothetical protein
MPRVTLTSRLVRGRRFDRNPLRRASDRAETVVLIMLVVVASRTVTAEVAGVAALAIVVALAGILTRWLLNKRRMAGWDADWHATGPRWTTHA